MLAAASLWLAGCGEGDATADRAFDVPERAYALSTTDARWRNPPPPSEMNPQGIPVATCGPGGLAVDCCNAVAGVTIDCQRHPLACQTDGTCALDFVYESVSTVNLAREVGALEALDGRVLAEVTIEALEAEVASSFNVSVPQLDLFVAPAAVTTTQTGQARLLGVIPMKPPGFNGRTAVTIDAAGQQAFSALARDVRTPFNLIASWRIVVRPGTPAPTGQVNVELTGRARARF